MTVGPQQRLYILEQGRCKKSEGEKVPITRQASQKTKTHPMLQRTLSVLRTDDTLCAPGSHFGLLECLYGCPHQYTLTAVTAATTLSISRDGLSDLLGGDRDAMFEIMRHSVRMHLATETLALLDPEWRYVDPNRLERILRSADVKRYGKWETIFNQGQTMNSICMLEKGTCAEYDFNVDLLKSIDVYTFDSVENVEHFIPGDHLGTVQFAGASRNAVASSAVVAVTECTILHVAVEIIEAETPGMKQDFARQFLA